MVGVYVSGWRRLRGVSTGGEQRMGADKVLGEARIWHNVRLVSVPP